VVVGATADTSGGMIGVASHGGVLIGTCAADVMRFLAVAGNVPISLAFGTPERFLLVLPDNNMFVFDTDPIVQYFVSCVHICYLKESECFLLF
jgi:hypothetical protein